MKEQLLEELDLDLGSDPLRLPPEVDYIEFSRDLTAADLEALARREPFSNTPPLKRIHSTHHSLARCLATGLSNTNAGLITGYSASRISILQRDPAFRDLVEDYRREAKSACADLSERMAGVSLDAIELLHERLQDNPEDFSVPLLLDVIKAFADRTGHGPGATMNLKVDQQFIDRPPRESFEDWENRRKQELIPPTPLKRLN